MRLAVNEKDSLYVDAVFTDETGAPSTPTAIEVGVYCLTTGATVRALGSAGVSPAPAVTIALASDDMKIRADANARELKRITVVAYFGASVRRTKTVDVEVVNTQLVS